MLLWRNFCEEKSWQKLTYAVESSGAFCFSRFLSVLTLTTLLLLLEDFTIIEFSALKNLKENQRFENPTYVMAQ